MRRQYQLMCVGSAWVLITVALLAAIFIRSSNPACPCDQAETVHFTEPPERHPGASKSPSGYVVALRYYEQQTEALHNLLQFQCFASSYGMTVLEPFTEGSMFTSDISAIAKGKTCLKFRDLFDIDLWNEQTAGFGYPGLASWSDFLRNAPKRLIVYCIRYRSLQSLQSSIPQFSYRSGCNSNCLNATVQALGGHGFKLVRSACVNFVDHGDSITTDSFMKTALGKYKPNEVTIVLNAFHGFFGLYRLPVLSNCGLIHHTIKNMSVRPSKQIFQDVGKYIELNFDNRPYVAIIARIERVVLYLKRNITLCSENVLKVLSELNHHPLKRFLAMDVGKFGSKGATSLKPAGEVLFKAVYGNARSFNEWERTFESFALGGSSSAAYIANLQRTIASQADCLIMVGGGSFQHEANLSYMRNHPNPSSQCVYKVCT